ncbi:MAG: sterol desaturase family protein [Alphaproteobacteria bacterium]|nr:sterol desaturase family protein [Alphaproteobacteria bacterium]
MTILGFGEGAFRFALFVSIFLAMSLLEALMPRRERRFPRGRRWLTNLGILASDYLATLVVFVLVPVTATVAALWAEANAFGLFYWLGVPVWAQWILGIALLDFVIWGQHLITHKVPVLWRIHRVHHTDEDLDASSAIRFHPVEIVLSVFIKSAAVVLIGAPALVVVAFEALVNGSALFNHANLRLPPALDRVLRLVLVTPDMHRVHHSVYTLETNSNYGFALSVWDRLFRTYVPEPRDGHDNMRVGLIEWQDDKPTQLLWSLALPFRNPPQSRPDALDAEPPRT